MSEIVIPVSGYFQMTEMIALFMIHLAHGIPNPQIYTTRMHTYANKHTYIYTNMHIYIQTYVHTYIHT